MNCPFCKAGIARHFMTSHHGVQVRSNSPVPGVTHKSKAQYIQDEILDGVSLLDGGGYILIGCWTATSEPRLNILGIEDTTWTPDPEGDYSAIVNPDGFVKVILSKYTQKASLSLYSEPGWGPGAAGPGTADLGKVGDFLAYTLPPEIWSR